ncbi:uncharacterized protein LOC106670682 [Cimex lectularius]|uniref:Uncharacterized protein n=1 Tax=Cimex lectularius TaxID=79782 RepID=A0A8I6S204_CIMLE|nr:uncharacterized protein LOC106670682 [Cimex lectularius]
MTRSSYLLLYACGCFLSLSTKNVLACGGYELITHKLQNCGGSASDIRLENFNVSLNSDCFVDATGCVENKKAFKTTKVHYKISKGKLYNKEGHDDICQQLPKASNDIKLILSFFGISQSCPVKARKICGGNETKLNLKKYESSMGLLAGGVLKAYAMITTEVGLSCLEFEGEVIKKKVG